MSECLDLALARASAQQPIRDEQQAPGEGSTNVRSLTCGLSRRTGRAWECVSRMPATWKVKPQGVIDAS